MGIGVTDNTEAVAVEKLTDILLIQYDGWDNHELAKAILAAIQADPLAYVKPKPLEWISKGGNRHKARFLGTCYVIEPYGDGFGLFVVTDGCEEQEIGCFPIIEAAQIAAYENLCKCMKVLF